MTFRHVTSCRIGLVVRNHLQEENFRTDRGGSFIRKQIWKNASVKFWYRQNIFLYVNADLIRSRPEFVEAMQFADDLLLIHTEILQRQLSVRSTLKALPARIWKASTSRVRALMTRS